MEHELKCRFCDRFLEIVDSSRTVKIKCGNSSCRKLRNGLDTYNIVFMSDYNKQHQHQTTEVANKV